MAVTIGSPCIHNRSVILVKYYRDKDWYIKCSRDSHYNTIGFG